MGVLSSSDRDLGFIFRHWINYIVYWMYMSEEGEVPGPKQVVAEAQETPQGGQKPPEARPDDLLQNPDILEGGQPKAELTEPPIVVAEKLAEEPLDGVLDAEQKASSVVQPQEILAKEKPGGREKDDLDVSYRNTMNIIKEDIAARNVVDKEVDPLLQQAIKEGEMIDKTFSDRRDLVNETNSEKTVQLDDGSKITLKPYEVVAVDDEGNIIMENDVPKIVDARLSQAKILSEGNKIISEAEGIQENVSEDQRTDAQKALIERAGRLQKQKEELQDYEIHTKDENGENRVHFNRALYRHNESITAPEDELSKEFSNKFDQMMDAMGAVSAHVLTKRRLTEIIRRSTKTKEQREAAFKYLADSVVGKQILHQCKDKGVRILVQQSLLKSFDENMLPIIKQDLQSGKNELIEGMSGDVLKQYEFATANYGEVSGRFQREYIGDKNLAGYAFAPLRGVINDQQYAGLISDAHSGKALDSFKMLGDLAQDQYKDKPGFQKAIQQMNLNIFGTDKKLTEENIEEMILEIGNEKLRGIFARNLKDKAKKLMPGPMGLFMIMTVLTSQLQAVVQDVEEK